ncbi:putative Ig domain-containing protein [Pontibacter sp. E15-1]|uniref:PKD domain-containing protein n=1 Tax=Pontibacter sp. E15-1 TaxID=2919918 RepID=UPI001F5018AE|nr:putative Ig domain-containing protein [Pontibacter sp. E15-1]MCJ8164434.1 putative Ig domain-containing protein [Pontibacter sp. E15-1]
MLPCDQLKVAVPFVLDFEASEVGIPDINGLGTGFTLVSPYSGTRLAADGKVSDLSIPGYESSKIKLNSGHLELTTNKGIAYRDQNNQLNALGVKVDSREILQVETTVLNPFYGTKAEQAGLWFGVDDKTYIKLTIIGNKVELRREIHDITAGVGSTDQRITNFVSGLDRASVQLRLVIDPVNETVEGYYAVNGASFINVGQTYETASLGIAGMGLTNNTANTGIYATHRNGSQPVLYTFSDFAISSPTPLPPSNRDPVVVEAPKDQVLQPGKSFSFSAGAYADPDPWDALVYTASLADESPLPNWLTFDAVKAVFSGTAPTQSKVLYVKVRATDKKGASVTATFKVMVPEAGAALVSNIQASSGSSYAQAQLAVGATHYTDRAYTITSVPSLLSGAILVRTANDDKRSTASALLGFDLSGPATLYVAYDPRSSALPAWLSGWQKLAERVGVNDPKISHMELYSKAFPAGAVSLGGNLQAPAVGAQNNYFVLAKAVDQAAQYTLAVSAGAGGSMSKSPDQPTYASGAQVTLTAIPAQGYVFVGWGGDASGTTNPLSVTMNRDKSISASFALAPQPGALVSNIQASSGSSYAQSQLAVGVAHYTDRTYTISSVPALLSGAILVRTANDDKRSTASALLGFDLSGPATLYVAYDPRSSALPAWLSGWQKLAERVGVDDPKISHMELYSKAFPAGAVSLGGNLQSPAVGAQNNYFVLAKAASSGSQIPVANAGPDKQITLPTNSVLLEGSGSDADGTIQEYRWRQISGPSTAAFSTKAVAQPTVQNLIAGNYVFGLIVVDNAGNLSPEDAVTVSVAPAPSNSACLPISMFPCKQLRVSLPLNLSFDGPVSNTVADKKGAGTGFTMIDAPSEPRTPEDSTPSYPGIPGYEPANLSLNAGALELTTNKGIAYAGNNNQLNTLGVEVATMGELLIETALVNPYVGTASQQAGLWLGLGDKTYVKLAVVNSKIELRRELNDASNGSGDGRLSGTISGLASKRLNLRMTMNPGTQVVEGFYSIDDGATYKTIGTVSVSGMGITNGYAYTGIFATHRNGTSPVVYTFDDFSVETVRPYVTAVRPANGAVNLPLDQSVSVDLAFPSGQSINGNTVNTSTVKLYTVEIGGGKEVAGTVVNATAAGDAITLSAPLKPNMTYEFVITDMVKDGNGYAMVPFVSRFTTTSSVPETPTDLSGVSFTEQTLIDKTFGTVGFTSLAIGPDHRLYAASSDGRIERWDLNADGTLDNHITISPFGAEKRLLIGLRFDPAASASNLTVWVSHSSGLFNNPPAWSGKISKINLGNPYSPQVTDYVINLPRSYKDHATNGIDFGPDGALYFTQGSNTAMGDPDAAWGNRKEELLTAAVLRLDIARAQQIGIPLDAKTGEGGTYNPSSPEAPLTVYASGVRNAYDLVWHSNKELYVPTNGSAAGGNTPALLSGTKWSNGQAFPGPDVASVNDVRVSQNDYLFRVAKGGYYGHPNTLRNEYIMNGGNPTNRQDPGEVVWTVNNVEYGYPVGTPVEPNYRGWAYDFGLNISPNGVIEYKSNAFGGKLKGKLLVCRFSGGDDVIVLEPGVSNKDIIRATEGIKIPGFRRPFANPLDIIEDVKNGNLYLSEYHDGNGGGQPRITLLKADQPAMAATGVSQARSGASVPGRLSVYPNPTSDGKVFVSVQQFGMKEPVRISVLDTSGRVVHTESLLTDAGGAGKVELRLDKATPHGVYIIKATSSAAMEVGKLLIQ